MKACTPECTEYASPCRSRTSWNSREDMLPPMTSLSRNIA